MWPFKKKKLEFQVFHINNLCCLKANVGTPSDTYFVLDSGADCCIITPQFFDTLQDVEVSECQGTIGIGGIVVGKHCVRLELAIDKRYTYSDVFLIQDIPTFDERVVGILGLRFLEVCCWDFVHDKILVDTSCSLLAGSNKTPRV